MQIKKWKTLSRREVFSHPRMTLVEDTVELPDGVKTDYLRMSPSECFSVAIIAINDLGQILLQQEYSYPTGEVLWQLPGGGSKEGESVTQAANRELAEESGYKASQVREQGFFYTNNRRSDERQYVVVCSGLKDDMERPDPEEFIDNVWMDKAELKSMIAKGEVRNINLLAALQLYFSRNNQANTFFRRKNG